MKLLSRLTGALLSVLIIGGGVYALINSQKIFDWYALRDYDPPTRIASIASETTMNDSARTVFYVNHPLLQDKATFKNSCDNLEQTIVLGCYVEHRGIYLLDVSDQRLNGVVEVTAAHELLHAMYDRLDDDERTHVDELTSRYFASLDNDRIKNNIENYRKRDASVVPNELHSILATEVRDLNPELEAYYQRYFSNRKAIVSLSEKYEKTFTDIENQVKAYDAQLKSMKTDIDNQEEQLKALGESIDSEKKRLDSLLASGREQEYNAAVPGFNQLVNRYNALIRARQTEVAEYNRIVEQRNSLSTAEADLIKSLKTGAQEIPDKAPN